jgi:hypothetical protein
VFFIGLFKNAVWSRVYLLFGHLLRNIVNISKKKQFSPDEIFDVRKSCKIPELFGKLPLSGAGKHLIFQVTQCLRFVTTNAKFNDRWKRQTSNICIKNKDFYIFIGLSSATQSCSAQGLRCALWGENYPGKIFLQITYFKLARC